MATSAAPRIGGLRDYVSILTRSETRDTQGGRAVTWVDLVTGNDAIFTRLHASVKPLTIGPRYQERFQAAAIGSQLAYQVVLRYRATITAKMRVLWRPYKSAVTKTLEIHGVTALEGGRQWIALDCGEVT